MGDINCKKRQFSSESEMDHSPPLAKTDRPPSKPPRRQKNTTSGNSFNPASTVSDGVLGQEARDDTGPRYHEFCADDSFDPALSRPPEFRKKPQAPVNNPARRQKKLGKTLIPVSTVSGVVLEEETRGDAGPMNSEPCKDNFSDHTPSEPPESRKEREAREHMFTEFTEEYYDIVEGLPLELGKNLNLIGDLGASVEVCQKGLREDIMKYLNFSRHALEDSQHLETKDHMTPKADLLQKLFNSAKLETFGAIPLFQPVDRQSEASIPSDLKQLLMEISKKMCRVQKLSRDKLDLAESIYEDLDRHLQRLDGDLEKYQDLEDEDNEATRRCGREDSEPNGSHLATPKPNALVHENPTSPSHSAKEKDAPHDLEDSLSSHSVQRPRSGELSSKDSSFPSILLAC